MTPTTLDVPAMDGVAATRSPVDARPTSTGWLLSIVNGVAWLSLVSLVMAVAPDVDADAPVDLLSLAISQVFWMSGLGAVVGLATRSRAGFAFTGVGGGALVIGALTCYIGGHTGAWIGVQAMAGLGLMATGVASWRVTR